METNRALAILWVCVLGSGLAVFLASHRHPGSGTADAAMEVSSSPEQSPAFAPSMRERFPGAPLAGKWGRRIPKRANSEGIPAASPFPEGGSWDEIRDWVTQNRDASLAWVSNAAAGPMRDDVSELVCIQLGQTNPPQALALAERLGGSHEMSVMENVTQLWAEQDQQAAYSWAVSRPPGQQRDLLLGRIAFVESKSSPEEAAKLVALEISAGAAQNEAAMSVLNQWAAKDANAALSWAQSFPEGNLRDRAINEVKGVANTLAGSPMTN